MNAAPAIGLEEIATRAASLGASLAGAVPFPALLRSPSHRSYPACLRLGETGSVIVVALAHEEDRPDLDWWINRQGRTQGNRRLMAICRELGRWLIQDRNAQALLLSYQPGGNGVFLKDAAVLAGLGVMGRNNLLITPRYGPRVRLRALRVDRIVKGSGPLSDFSPCSGCDAPCLRACPAGALSGGVYRRNRCVDQMRKDEHHRIAVPSVLPGVRSGFQIRYCRRCELACPVGKDRGEVPE